jgi:hypothetical protein
MLDEIAVPCPALARVLDQFLHGVPLMEPRENPR